jgi:Ca2+-binding EF-hand superfamily protein
MMFQPPRADNFSSPFHSPCELTGRRAMQFTPQQRMGYKGYSKGVLIGNWSEDFQVMEDKMGTYQKLKAEGKLVSKTEPEKVMLSPAPEDGYLRFGTTIMIKSVDTEAYLAVDSTGRFAPRRNQALVTCSKNEIPSIRNTWVIRRGHDPQWHFYEKVRETEIVHYGQQVRLVNEYGHPAGHVSLSSLPLSANCQSKSSSRQEVTASLGLSQDCVFVIEQADGKAATQPLDGQPIPVNATVVLRHKPTNTPLICDKAFLCGTNFGNEYECAAHLAKPQSIRISTPTMTPNFWTFRVGGAGGKFIPYRNADIAGALRNVKEKILRRGGSLGFRGLVKSFQILEDEGQRKVTRRELKDGMELYGVPLTTYELDVIFKEFDTNGDQTIKITEFLHSIRGHMNLHREDLVKEVFHRLDKNHSGLITFDQLRNTFVQNLKNHPDVVSGATTEDELIRHFMAGWDKAHDSRIDLREFTEYYNDLSVNVEDDSQFEAMVKQTWFSV